MTQITTQKYAEKYEEALGFTLDTIFNQMAENPDDQPEVLISRTFNEWFVFGKKNECTTNKALSSPANINRFREYGNLDKYIEIICSEFTPKDKNLKAFHDFVKTLYVSYLEDVVYLIKKDCLGTFQDNSDLASKKFASSFNTETRTFSY